MREQEASAIRVQIKRAIRKEYARLRHEKYQQAHATHVIILDPKTDLVEQLNEDAIYHYDVAEEHDENNRDSLQSKDTSCIFEELTTWLQTDAKHLSELWEIQRKTYDPEYRIADATTGTVIAEVTKVTL